MNLRFTFVSNLLLTSLFIGDVGITQQLPNTQQMGEQPDQTVTNDVKTTPPANTPTEELQTPRTKYDFEKHGGIVYDRGKNYRLTLDVYQPQGKGPFPAVLAIHGGAWRSGSKITMLRHAWALAAA